MVLRSKIKIILLAIVGIVIILQLLNLFRVEKYESQAHVGNMPKRYEKLVTQQAVYRDSTYTVYIANILKEPKIIYLRKDSLSDLQKRSKFFLHIYPADSSLTLKDQNLLAFDFKKEPLEFIYHGTSFYLFETKLPEIGINKINTGQYGYKGDNNVTWKIQHVLDSKEIQPILKSNGEKGINSFDSLTKARK